MPIAASHNLVVKVKRRNLYKEHAISVDPGLSGTGVVYWRNGQPTRAQVLLPPQYVSRQEVKPGEDDLVARARWLASMIVMSAGFERYTLIIEFPSFQTGAGREMGWKTGSLQKLTFLVGVMVGYLPSNWRVILIEPSGWKGQLPKEVVTRRMIAKYGKALCNKLEIKTHAWDAMGIGEWAWRQEFMS